MRATEAITSTLALSDTVLQRYLSDLSDQDLLTRPVAGTNHIAWQLGHLIASDCDLLESVCPGKSVALPEGFREAHSRDQCANDDPAQFRGKDEYVALLDQTRQATSAALASMSPEDLERPSPEHFREMFPTVGDIFILLATHRMMHAGQFVPVRRMLGKPVVI